MQNKGFRIGNVECRAIVGAGEFSGLAPPRFRGRQGQVMLGRPVAPV